MTEQKSGSGKKIAMIAAVGCLAVVAMCCLTGFGLHFAKQSGYESGGQEHAERFLGAVQGQSWAEAFGASEYMGDTRLYRLETFQGCLESTALGRMHSYSCDGGDGAWYADDGVAVHCTVSTVEGSEEIAVHVNSPDDTFPYLGFIWFARREAFSDRWASDECARWSGREYFDDPPEGFVRP